ncbi:MAG: cell division protein SepF [Firmicutes bacterium HGW-Firmicutes-12]|jgi:cell division inhibitor SepF|nr:MAG: cell division protein SepF [Firmicutes bacterium HGW-Firmicutes-12]
MGVVDKFLDIMGFTEIREEVITEQENMIDDMPELKQRKSKGQLVPFNTSKEQIKVVLIEPVVFDDCQQISDSLKNKRTVIINLENMDISTARRIIDFVGGTAYALGGTLQKIGAGIIIAVPSNVDISGDINSMSQPKEVFAWINKLNQGTEFSRG